MTNSEKKTKKKSMFLIKKWLLVQAAILTGILIFGFYNAWTPQGNYALAIGIGMFGSYMIMFLLQIYDDVKSIYKNKKSNGGESA